ADECAVPAGHALAVDRAEFSRTIGKRARRAHFATHMSSTPPPDRPTERLQPSPAPVPPQRPVYEERVVAPAVDPNVVLLRLEDAVASLRTGLMVVGVIAVAALAVAIYGLTQDGGDSGSRSGLASDARVDNLEGRIDRLSRQVQALRSSGGSSSDALQTRVDAIERTVKTLASRPAADPQQAIDQLSGRIDDVIKDVDALKQAPATTP
ncbi:MAG: hypothetical protein ACRDMZ_13640, partial [Solirubrobacteraceae bacterium]